MNEDVRDGGVVLVVSLDTANALSLPWPDQASLRGQRRSGIPPVYIR